MKKLLAVLASITAVLAIPFAVAGALLPSPAALQSLPMLNSAGDHVYAGLYLTGDTAITTTVTTAGTYYPLVGASLVDSEDDGSGCLSVTDTTGKITVAARCGIGEYEVIACMNNIKATDGGRTVNARLELNGTGVGPIPEVTAASTAVEQSLGCIFHIVDLTAVGDYLELNYTSSTNGDTVATKNASFVAKKLLNK